jgi:hypothetical protein
MIAFGWGDLGRVALPMFTIFGTFEMAKSLRGLAWWGAAAALSILYSQETGPTAVVASIAALGVDSLLRRGSLGVRETIVRGARRIGAFIAGGAAAWAVFIAVYGVFGRAGLFLHNMFLFVTAFASGSVGGFPFPVSELSFETWDALTAPTLHEGMVLEYVLPVFVYAVTGAALLATWASRRWTPRSTLLFALFLFGVVTFRAAMGRSDYYHLIAITAPSVMLFMGLAADASDALSTLRPANLLFLLPFVWMSFRLSGTTKGFDPRTMAMLRGDEVPSAGNPYAHPDIPRAGDIFLPQDTIDLVHAIQKRSRSDEKIFVRIAFIEGAELYFLADRVNPTRCDLMAEIVTTEVQDQLLADLKAHPPRLDIGTDTGLLGEATVEYLRNNWRIAEYVGGQPVYEYIEVPR